MANEVPSNRTGGDPTTDARRAADDPSLTAVAEHGVRRPGVWMGLAVGALLAALIAAFIAQNRQQVHLEWLWFDFTVGAWWGLLAAFAAGAVASPLIAWSIRHAHRRRQRERDVVGRARRRGAAGSDGRGTRVWPSMHRTP